MAYLNLLLSVSERQVQTIRADTSNLLRPTEIVGVSHLVAYWVEVQPLGHLLGEAIDGGNVLSDQFWHPLRQPKYHDSGRVRTLRQELDLAWATARLANEDELRIQPSEITKVIQLFDRASQHGECVVSVLEPPADAERADRVVMPFDSAEQNAAAPPDVKQKTDSHENNSWPLLTSVGLASGFVIGGALGLCYWRFRRQRDST